MSARKKVKKTFNISERLWEAAEKFAPVAGYANAQELFIWSGFYAIAIGKPHPITAPIAQASKNIQEMFIEDMVAAFERGETSRGSYFAAVLEDVMARFKIEYPPEVVKAIIADAVRNRPAKKKADDSDTAC